MENNLDTIRHSASHILAMAMLKIDTGAKLAIGPVIENGFYYDFELSKPISSSDFEKIEKIMLQIKNKKIFFSSEKISIKEAKSLFKSNTYKLELIDELAKKGEKEVSVYKTGDFIDLCRGPHVQNSEQIGFFKLTKTSGAYWRGDEKNKMLTRIYGTSWLTQKDLDDYITKLDEATSRDHKKLGKELDLFIFSDLIGPGLPLYTQKGTVLRNILKNYSNSLRKKIGYEEVYTPQMNKSDLFKISGHYDKYNENNFNVKSNYTDEEYFLKPMNCPQHTQIYAHIPRSYKDLPIRMADFANLYRDEKPGELSGLTRLRAFSQDDGHAFVREDQIEEEFLNILSVIQIAMKKFGLSYKFRLSLRDEKNKSAYLGDDALWEKSQKILENILISQKINYEKAEGEAAFYGPKMDLIIKDSLDREWQLSTIQIDVNMPNRFKLEYTTEDNSKKTPIMIHSAILGSTERFMAMLIEHYAGAFPLWLSPVQIKIITVNDQVIESAKKLKEKLTDQDFRVELDISNESVSKKIRNGELEKVPYLIVYGQKEEKTGALSIRKDNQVTNVKSEEFIRNLRQEL